LLKHTAGINQQALHVYTVHKINKILSYRRETALQDAW